VPPPGRLLPPRKRVRGPCYNATCRTTFSVR
jgi:hypothetical protein